MATKFKKGQEVKLAAVVPSGPIEAFRMDDEGNVFCLISWVDASGASNSRWFKEDQLTSV